MGFLMPKVPKPPKPPSSPIIANAANDALPVGDPSSLISTAAQGLRAKATTQKVSLIGGSQ